MLTDAVIVQETQDAATMRLVGLGYDPEVAAEIAIYLAQATDLPGQMPGLVDAFAAGGVRLRCFELDDLPARVADLRGAAVRSILWNQTDGIRFYRGSAVPALARLAGIPRFGSPATAQHLCQDKFFAATLAATAGLLVPPSLLLDGADVLARSGGAGWDEDDIFVKPNTLGAKLGIWADSRCRGRAAARDRAARIHGRYGDRAVVQPYIAGHDVRVSFLDLGGDFAAQLGIFRLVPPEAGETGGDFMTMKDNETLSGATDTAGGRGGFGAVHAAAFVPHMRDLRQEAPAETIGAITDAARRAARLFGLTDLFSMDFRLDSKGQPWFLEFEVCPAVTIYDFRTYLDAVHGLALGPALLRSMRLAHARAGGRAEA
jgi:D-alanine-D-alanine ligase